MQKLIGNVDVTAAGTLVEHATPGRWVPEHALANVCSQMLWNASPLLTRVFTSSRVQHAPISSTTTGGGDGLGGGGEGETIANRNVSVHVSPFGSVATTETVTVPTATSSIVAT